MTVVSKSQIITYKMYEREKEFLKKIPVQNFYDDNNGDMNSVTIISNDSVRKRLQRDFQCNNYYTISKFNFERLGSLKHYYVYKKTYNTIEVENVSDSKFNCVFFLIDHTERILHHV